MKEKTTKYLIHPKDNRKEETEKQKHMKQIEEIK